MKQLKRFNYLAIIIGLLISLSFSAKTWGQYSSSSNVTTDAQGRPMAKKDAHDSLTHRDPNEDSLTITYIMYDSSQVRRLDSAINDFNPRMPAPYYYNDLGNPGSPANSFLFTPMMRPGWDAGFHVMDPYRLTLENTKYFTATRPYTDLTYIMGGGSEQIINLLHTQNRNSKVNFAFEFNLLGAPGSYKNQNANYSNLRFNISTFSEDRRYSTNLIYFSNSMRPSANGGVVSWDETKESTYNDPFYFDTKLANSSTSNRNPFKTSVSTGNIFNDKTLFFRHSFDFGQKDSIVKDDTVRQRMFYPRLRLQHSLQLSTSDYQYLDANPVTSDYLEYYNYIISSDTVRFRDKWTELTNEFSLISYPDKKNTAQFLKLNGGWQYLNGKLGSYMRQTYTNIYAGAEYRNTTRNKKWNLEAVGKLYLTGNYKGDYSAYASLQRNVENIGSLKIGAHNVNKTLPFIFNSISEGRLSFDTTVNLQMTPHTDFPVSGDSSWKKENIMRLFAELGIPKWNLHLYGNYYIISNYGYFDGYFDAKQYSPLFNLIQIGANKETKLTKYFKWYLEAFLQQKAGNAPVNVPFLFMRNRIAFEGNFFHNLYLATGLSIRYYTPYKADNYSPFIGQYFYQNDTRISNRPDISYYFNFRISRFRFFSELSNLNTLNYSKTKGFGFNEFNQTAPNYPQAGMKFRFGFKWMFVN